MRITHRTAACQVFFSELPSSQAAELAFGLGEETQVVTVDEDIDWKVLFEGVGAPNCRAPVVVANLPELGHSVLYAGATEEEVAAVTVATIPAAFLFSGCEAVQEAADVVLLSDFLGSLAFAKRRCAAATASPEKFVLFSLCPKCSPPVLAQASASAASVEHLDLMEAEVIARQEVEKRLGDAPNTTLDGGAMKEVLTAQGLSSSLLQRLAVPAQHYITSLPVIGGFAQNPALLEAHLAYLCAQAAASAVADRVALLGGTADEIGQGCLKAAEGTSASQDVVSSLALLGGSGGDLGGSEEGAFIGERHNLSFVDPRHATASHLPSEAGSASDWPPIGGERNGALGGKDGHSLEPREGRPWAKRIRGSLRARLRQEEMRNASLDFTCGWNGLFPFGAKETYTLPQILKTAIDALNPSPEETRAAAAAAAKEEHLAFDAAIHAVAQTAQPNTMGPLLRKTAKWDPLQRGSEATVPLLARLAATQVAQHLARRHTPPQLVTAAARGAAEALGLPSPAAAHVATRQAAAAAARAAGQCRAAGEAAREAVRAALPGTEEEQGRQGALVSVALPEAVKAIMKGASEMGDLARCARAAAEGAIGKGAQTALQGQIEEAADLVAFQAAKAAVTEGLLPFQVTERAEKAAAALRLSSPGGHESDGLVAARAILEHGLWVSAEHENTARLARVAAEAGGLRIEEARHQAAQQLSKLVANHKAELMSLDPASSRHVAAKARESARAAGCKEAEVAWVASHAASAACATTAAARGASSEVIAQVALAAARASGVPDMEARQISAWSAAKSASEQALSFGDSAHAGQAAQRAAHASGLEGETAHRLAGEAAAQVVLAEAGDGGDTYSHIAPAPRGDGMPMCVSKGASVLAASLACPKAAEAAAILQRSPAEIGHAARAAAQAAGALDQKGSEEAAVAAASAVVQSALSDSTSQGLAPAEVARKAQEAWASAGATGRVVAPCIAATAVLKRPLPLRVLRPASSWPAFWPRRWLNPRLEEEDELMRNGTAAPRAREEQEQWRRWPCKKACGLRRDLDTVRRTQDVACVAAAAALAKHSKHVRQEAEEVGSLVLQATRAAGCEDQKGLAAAITAASRSAAKASLALHGTSPASVAEAAWSAARKVLAHVGRSSSKRIWAHLVSIEAVSAWQAQGLVAGLDAHAAEAPWRGTHVWTEYSSCVGRGDKDLVSTEPGADGGADVLRCPAMSLEPVDEEHDHEGLQRAGRESHPAEILLRYRR
eukprot:g33186.t1